MTDWPETRLRMQLLLHRAWPFQVLTWLRLRSRPARDPVLQDVITYLQGEIARLDAAAEANTAKDLERNVGYKEYKCPKCGRVHAAIPLAEAKQVLKPGDDPSFLYRCFACPTPTTQFVPAGPADAPNGCTLTVVVEPDAWGSENDRPV